MADVLLTITEAAQRLRVSVRTVEREARDGRIAIVHIRSRRMIEPAELGACLLLARATRITLPVTGLPKASPS